MELFAEEDLENYTQLDKSDEDVFETIIRNREHLPPMYFDCGISDLLINYNRELHNKLKNENIMHIYNEFPGGHEWAYWEKYIKESLLFFSSHLKWRHAGERLKVKREKMHWGETSEAKGYKITHVKS